MEKKKLKKYCNDGLSIRKIVELENLSYTTIRYWLKKYKLNTNGWFTFSEKQLRDAINKSLSYNEVLGKLNKNNSSNSYRSLKRAIKRFNIDTSHFLNRSEVMKLSHKKRELLNEEIFIVNSKTSRSTVKKRILRDKLFEYKCVKCGQNDTWNNEKLVLIIDHINGINNDNRLENLRFVCPNCNSQLKTHCRNNK